MAALGLVETMGLLAAVEGADVMLKTADVRLLEKNMVGGGLVTITVAGEVAAVKVAVEAAVAAIRRLSASALVSGHVIARPDPEVAQVIALLPETTGKGAGAMCAAESGPARVAGSGAAALRPAEANSAPTISPAGARGEEPLTAAQLRKMSLSRLVALARNREDLSIPPEAIASADRKTLLKKLMRACNILEE